ncbi:ABC transporter permease [Paenibacillus borealis]|uniref:ABC transporter permease n=1 Tax=Paenibacillus borealis TaxID=160799 RepID=A0ABX3HK44_PAEBO|nr:FtsX-like permease family protein [Paenibacillus borealis]OMD49462.1 ABC transporter permease [Paenibacillus borealis]
MNIFNKVALQGLKKNRTRTLVTIIGVVLSAAMITAVATFGVSLLSYMTNGAIAKYGDWHVEFLDVDSSFVQERTHDDGVASTATFENIGYAALDGGKTPGKPYLFLAGYSEETLDALPVTLFSGRMPENSGEILVSGKVATEAGVKFAVGDTVSLTVGSRMSGGEKLGQNVPYNAQSETFVPQGEKTYKVVGICQRPRFEENSAPGYTLITKTDAGDSTDSFSLFVTLKNPRQIHAYIDKTAGDHAYFLNDYVLRFMGLSDDNMFNRLLYAVGGIVVAIIMIGSIFLIYNSFNISLNERTQQFGILMSVGATAKQLRNSVLFEGLCIGAVGIPIGILVGMGGIKLVIDIVAKTFGNILYTDVPLNVTVSIPAIIAAAAVSMVTILISAYIPARKAVNTPVMECIRQTNEVKVESKAVKTSNLSQHIYGLEGTLALKNFKRNKKRYRSIVLSLVLSVVLFISASAFVTDLKLALGQSTEVTTYDVAFAARDMDDSEMLPLYDKMKTADGVYASSYQALVTYSGTAKASDMTDDYWEYAPSYATGDTVKLPMQFQFLDESTYLSILAELGLPAEEYTGPNAKLISVAKIEEAGEYVDVFKNSAMNFTIVPKTDDGAEPEQGKNVSITFVDTAPPDTLPILDATEPTPIFFYVMAPYSLKEQYVTPDTHVAMKGMTFQSESPTQSAAEMETMIEGAGITAAYNMYNMNRLMDESRNYIFIANVFAYTFIIMISLIAIANVFNTISTNIKLRRRELAMLRSVGMSEHDFQKMMNFECAFYGMRALLVGLPVAVIFSWLIYKGMFIGGADGIVFVLPWASIGISVFSVLFIVFVTMLYAISKIKKENIIDALRDDMT